MAERFAIYLPKEQNWNYGISDFLGVESLGRMLSLGRNIFKVFEICDAQAIELPSIRSTHFSIINST